MARQDNSFPIAVAPAMRGFVKIAVEAVREPAADDWIDFRALLASPRFQRAGLFLPREMLEQWTEAQR